MSERSVPDNALRRLFSRKPVAYYPELARAVGSVAAAIFLQEMCHWERYSKDRWVFRTQEEIQEDTALGISAQQSARERLKKVGALEEKRKGVPARLYYRVNHDNLERLLQTGSSSKQVPGNRPDKNAEIVQSINTGNDTGEDTPSSNDEEAHASPGTFVAYLREELDGSDVPLLRNREDRYAGEFNKLIKKGITEDVLYKCCDRIVERWEGDEHIKLRVELALEDVVNGKPPKRASQASPARLSASQRKAGYEWLFEDKEPEGGAKRDLDAELKKMREKEAS